jgi:hypothetical protein
MIKTKIYVPDIECDSCTKLLIRKFKDMEDIEDFNVESDGVEFTHEHHVKIEDIIETINELGFRASLRPFERKNLRERLRDFREHKHKYAMMMRAIRYTLLLMAILLIIETIAYFGFLKFIPSFLPKYGLWMLYLDISIATIGASLWYMYSYKTNVTCMTGMMIGMTVGMQIGMMVGIIFGAVNGFFIGSMVGMILGTIAGAIAGSSCGIMGILQGMMAGVMGGTMGPMIGLMMFTDHIQIFMPFFMLFNILILAGFIYMYYEEVIENRKDVTKRHIDFATFISIGVIATIILAVIMVYGPKSLLFGV